MVRITWSVTLSFKIVTLWFVILLFAIANGIVREAFLTPELGLVTGLILSGILLSICILLISYSALPWIGKRPARGYVIIGLAWLCLTLLFEFTFGLAQGKTWLQLFDAYTFKNDNIWPIVLVVTTTAPYLATKVRGWL